MYIPGVPGAFYYYRSEQKQALPLSGGGEDAGKSSLRENWEDTRNGGASSICETILINSSESVPVNILCTGLLLLYLRFTEVLGSDGVSGDIKHRRIIGSMATTPRNSSKDNLLSLGIPSKLSMMLSTLASRSTLVLVQYM